MGAFVGGLYAREGDLISSGGRVKQFSSRMGNLWRMLTDVTYPIVAYTTVFRTIQTEKSRVLNCLCQGHEFNRSIFKVTE
jgi:lysophospholipid hydrolase